MKGIALRKHSLHEKTAEKRQAHLQHTERFVQSYRHGDFREIFADIPEQQIP